MDQLSPDERKIGQDNYYESLGVTRREFLQGVVGAGAVSGAGLGAMYFGYSKVADPVRVGIIGTGDEGNVLIGGCTPEYVRIVAISDIRPSSIHRAFYGDWSSPAAQDARPGIIKKQGYSSYDEAIKNVKVYDQSNGGMKALLDDSEVEAVIIALPLHLHAPIAVQAMLKGKHVLTEKLMAHNVAQCKVMARVARETKLHLATGHQRHYSVLYDNAVHLIRQGVLGSCTIFGLNGIEAICQEKTRGNHGCLAVNQVLAARWWIALPRSWLPLGRSLSRPRILRKSTCSARR